MTKEQQQQTIGFLRNLMILSNKARDAWNKASHGDEYVTCRAKLNNYDEQINTMIKYLRKVLGLDIVAMFDLHTLMYNEIYIANECVSYDIEEAGIEEVFMRG